MARRRNEDWAPREVSLQELRLGWSEREFQAWVMGEAAANGWKVCHFHDSRRQRGEAMVGDADAAGWPDLVLVYPGQAPDASDAVVIWAELKRVGGVPTRAQEAWLAALKRLAMRMPQDKAVVWTPADCPEIEAVLRREARSEPGLAFGMGRNPEPMRQSRAVFRGSE